MTPTAATTPRRLRPAPEPVEICPMKSLVMTVRQGVALYSEFTDLSPIQIAKNLGVPVAVVNHNLSAADFLSIKATRHADRYVNNP
jgi:hypothetical protein